VYNGTSGPDNVGPVTSAAGETFVVAAAAAAASRRIGARNPYALVSFVFRGQVVFSNTLFRRPTKFIFIFSIKIEHNNNVR